MHNYVKKIQALLEHGTLGCQPGLYSLGIAHDEWCQMYLGAECNCDPDITIVEVTAANRDEIIAKIAKDTADFQRTAQKKMC